MPVLGGNMFTCNNYNLLVFTYYLKVFIASCMTVIPLIYFEKVFIKLIKYTKNNFNQSFKQLLSLGLTSEELIELINQNANKLPV